MADLLGVSDLFSRIKPVLASLLPGSEPDLRVRQLKPWARAVVTGWVLTALLALTGGAVLLCSNAPRYLLTAWHSLGYQLHLLTDGDAVTAMAGGLGLFMLILPPAGFILTYTLLCHGLGNALAVRHMRGVPSRPCPRPGTTFAG